MNRKIGSGQRVERLGKNGMPPADERRVEARTGMIHARMDFVARWPGATFSALATEHGIGRHKIARAAKRERWAYRARVIHTEKCLRMDEPKA